MDQLLECCVHSKSKEDYGKVFSAHDHGDRPFKDQICGQTCAYHQALCDKNPSSYLVKLVCSRLRAITVPLAPGHINCQSLW